MSYRDVMDNARNVAAVKYLTDLLYMCEGNVSQCARRAKLDRSNFLRLCRIFGVAPNDYRKEKNKWVKKNITSLMNSTKLLCSE